MGSRLGEGYLGGLRHFLSQMSCRGAFSGFWAHNCGMNAKRLQLGIGLGAVVVAGGVIAVVNLHDAPSADADQPIAITANAPLAQGALADIVSPTDGTYCGVVNGFTITSVHSPSDCEAALAMSTAYTTAVLAEDARETLGSGLMWSGEGWTCSRNFDDDGVTAHSQGLLCTRGDAVITLIYE